MAVVPAVPAGKSLAELGDGQEWPQSGMMGWQGWPSSGDPMEPQDHCLMPEETWTLRHCLLYPRLFKWGSRGR